LSNREHAALARMLSESVISAIGTAVGLALAYGLLGMLTRYLSVEDFGVYAVLVSMLELAAAVVLCGLPDAIERFTALYNARGEVGATRTLVTRGLLLTLVIGIGGYAVVALAAGPIARVFLGPADRSAALLVFAASLPTALLLHASLAVFVGHKRVRYYILVDRVVIPGLRFLLGAAALALGWGLLGWLGAYSATMAVGLLAALALLWAKIRPGIESHPRQRVAWREVFRFAWPLLIVNVTALVAKDAPVLWLGRQGDMASAGILRLYLQIAGSFVLVLQAVSRIHLPVMTELLSLGEREVARRTHLRVSKWSFAVGIYGVGMLVVLGPQFIALLFTPAYAGSFASLLVLSFGALVRLAYGPCHVVLQAIGATRVNLASALVGATVLALAGILAIPRAGIFGAVLAIALSWAAQDGLAAWQVYRRASLVPFGKAHVRALALAGATAGACLLIRSLAGWHGALAVVVLGVGFTGAYWAGALLWRVIDPVDRTLVAGLLGRLRGA
jgi:O-antigen/teichoic acid export membrane protein